ncbi:glutamate racemase [Thermoactinomyces sp. DSM 45892]|uniref:glutamate racemase n=1 Tax=Thermoactinomyces sp. DSM 45892 TaxID=1882753 RepID=UPI00089431AB|nr:glutamate racemase [Thermoactinomyces sp. DSM 45892]SDY77857.1 glutamate racemase [Thermoactinomyces sp. DSM 45892]
MDRNVIGVLDSGVGGLTVAKEIMRQLPKETVYYFGDTLRCPYGPRSTEEVRQFTFEIIDYLLQYPLKAIVIACNTATAAALVEVQKYIKLPVLGVIEPGSRAAIKASKRGEIGVIGTVGTIHSKAYEHALRRLNPDLTVHSLACPTLVPLVESGGRNTSLADQVVEQALRPFEHKKYDSLILGCTHYPLLMSSFKKVLPEHVELISSAEETAVELSTILQYKELLSERKSFHRFFTTGDLRSFQDIAQDWLGQVVRVEHVKLSSDLVHFPSKEVLLP